MAEKQPPVKIDTTELKDTGDDLIASPGLPIMANTAENPIDDVDITKPVHVTPMTPEPDDARKD